MSFRMRQAAHCDRCSHEWLAVGESIPTHCAKCKSRRWNSGEQANRTKPFAPKRFVSAAKPPSDADIAQAEHHLNAYPTALREAIDPMIESRMSGHDPKTCRVYKCGMCASAKVGSA